ncbi:MAG: hypothetical protein AAFP82_17340, partial [Bacteroidota bacterium]
LKVLELHVPRKIGKELMEKRRTLTEGQNQFLFTDFQQYLEKSRSGLTPNQYQANKNFVEFLQEKSLDQERICKEQFLAGRLYFLSQIEP